MTIPPGEFERDVAIHLFGTVYGMRYALPVMIAQGSGRIINTISRAAETAGAQWAAYSAAKAAIWAATRSTSAEHATDDILINMLIPGPTNTAIFGKEMPHLQSPEATYQGARFLATLPSGGPSGEVFRDGEPYTMFAAPDEG